MMSGVTFAMATVIVRGDRDQRSTWQPVSPLAYVIPSGTLSTQTVISCEEGQQVWVDVVMSNEAGIIYCSFEGISLQGFTGHLEFRY